MMENLSLQDGSQQQQQQSQVPEQGQGPPGQAPIPQLPPQMFTTAASLLDLTDKKLMVTLRDGKKLIGVLRSWDQYGNLVLQDTIERRFVSSSQSHYYTDVKQGIYLVRGENILLMGEIDLDKDDYIPAPYQKTDLATVFEMEKKQREEKKRKDEVRARRLKNLGFEGEHSGEALF